jgi:HTH-type transcriptional regulator/antitoxin HigA
MDLIGKNKIANYILRHPQARIALLTFIKEFPYRKWNIDSDAHVDWTFRTDGFDCLINVRMNYFAKAFNILALTTAEEEMNKWEQNLKELETAGNKEKIITKLVNVIVTVPPPPDVEEPGPLAQGNNSEVVANLFHSALKELTVDTTAEYERNLNRVNMLFDAKPETPEFEELINLLPKVIEYETYKLEFPKLKIFEVVKHRIALFSITPVELRYIIGDDEQVGLFFSGKLELTADVLSKLYEMAGLRAPVTDKRFF